MEDIKELDTLLKEYVKRFDDNFPVYVFRGTDEETIQEIKRCLKEGKPYTYEDDGARDY